MPVLKNLRHETLSAMKRIRVERLGY